MSIEIKNLGKNYGKKVALNNVSLTFENGICGLLGENGAGKSTMLNIMVTTLSQTKLFCFTMAKFAEMILLKIYAMRLKAMFGRLL